MNLWLYLHFPDMYLHSLNPDPQQPVAVVAGPRWQEGVSASTTSLAQLAIVQSNAAAKQRGVDVDMPLASALCLCPQLITHTAGPQQQQQLLQQRALWAYQFSATICLDYPQGLWLEVASMRRLFSGVASLHQQLQQQAAQQQWPLQCALASYPAAAKVLALQQPDTQASLRNEEQTLSRLSRDQQIQHSCQRLQSFTTEQLQLTAESQLALQRLGIHTLRQLQQLPMAELASRFDAQLIQQLMQLQGSQRSPLTSFKPPLNFADTSLFIHDVEHINGLLFPLKRQLATLCAFLAGRQLAINQLQLQLVHRQSGEEPINDSHWLLRLARPEYRYDELLQLLRYQLERRQLTAPVRQLTVCVDQFVPQQAQQHDIQLRHDTQRLHDTQQLHNTQRAANDIRVGLRQSNHIRCSAADELLNRLQSRLQPGQLFRLSCNRDARPEYAWQKISPQQHYPATGKCNTAAAEKHHTARASNRNTEINSSRSSARPLWLLATPVPCNPPQHIISGPERISSGWWHPGHQIQRDYYRVTAAGIYLADSSADNTTNAQLWVFRDAQQRWFIHGYFS